ncbi:MAG: restriction endonuclease subunit S [Actinobacteria bacterium]|nr:restriction endonuclease subunit S [Actinomycetota bacterium]
MSDLPKGWEWAQLDEVADIQGGIQKQVKRRPTRNKYPFLRVANVARGRLDLSDIHEIELFDGELERYRLKAGDLLVVEGNGTLNQLGRAAMWHDQVANCVHQNHLIRVRPTRALDPQYLEYLWNSPLITAQVGKMGASTSGLHTLSVSKLRPIVVLIPPLAEQRRIVTILDNCFSCIDAGCAVLASTIARVARHRDQFIAAACTGDFTPTESVAYPLEFAGVQDGVLPSLPGNWRWARLGEIADVMGGITKDTKRQTDVQLPEVPYLRVANVQRGHLDLGRVAVIRTTIDKIKQLRLQEGDVLLNEGGDRNKLGRGWIWEEQIPECIHQNHVFRARIRGRRLEPKLLAWHANTFGKEWCERNGKQSVNLASISLSKISLLPVPIPPQNEQSALVDLIEDHLIELNRLDNALQGALKQSAYLRRSLLIEAFAGRLVTQEPNDEPAAVLLERIRAERAVQPKTRRARRTPRKPNEQGSLL